MKFTFKAQKSSGEFYKGGREAADKFALAREFRASGETLISAQEDGGRTRILDLSRLRISFGRVGAHDRIVFARSLSGMLGAGLSLSRALGVLERQSSNRKLRAILASLSERIGRGESLHQALAAFPTVFSELFVAMVKAGEEGGNLAGALVAVAEQLDRAYALSRKVKGALAYPAIVVTAMLVVGVLMFLYVVPKLTATFADLQVELPLTTRVLLGVNDFLEHNILLGIGALLALALGARLAAKSRSGKRAIDFTLLHIPAISPLIKETNAARVCGTLSSLLGAGVPLLSALEITAQALPNTYFKEVLARGREAAQKGEPLASVFGRAEALFPAVLTEMTAVGEETGKLSPMLRDTAAFFEAEVDQKTKNLSTIIEPALMILVGVAVGFFAFAMISPMYSLMNSI